MWNNENNDVKNRAEHINCHLPINYKQIEEKYPFISAEFGVYYIIICMHLRRYSRWEKERKYGEPSSMRHLYIMC